MNTGSITAPRPDHKRRGLSPVGTESLPVLIWRRTAIIAITTMLLIPQPRILLTLVAPVENKGGVVPRLAHMHGDALVFV